MTGAHAYTKKVMIKAQQLKEQEIKKSKNNNQSINQSIVQSLDKSVIRSVSQSVSHHHDHVPWLSVVVTVPISLSVRCLSDCLNGKRDNYHVCSVQYCVQQLCTVQCTHTWTDLTVHWIGFCLTGPMSLCLDSFFVYVLHACALCRRVIRWGGPGGIEVYT